MSADSEEAQAGDVVGRMSDGKTAAALQVRVRLGESGLDIAGAAGADTRVWPYAGLEAAEPLSARSTDVLLTSRDDPGMTLFVGDAPFTSALAGRAPHLSTRASRWRHARPWIAVAGLFVAAYIVFDVFDISPSRAIATLLPDQARRGLGEEVLGTITESRRVCENADGVQALNRLAARLSTGAGNSKFKVVVVDWGLFNAFAVPGEQIVLTRGLLTKAKSPDEVAGVLAHEMGHGIARDPEAGLVRAIGLSTLLQIMMGGSSNTFASVGLALAQLSYTRGAERQADVTALRLLKDAGISPNGLASFFAHAGDIEGRPDMGDFSDLLSTHPATKERQKLAMAQPSYPATPSLSDQDWRHLRAICAPSSPASRRPH